MKEKWQSLDLREQYLVIAMSVVIGIFILFSFVWQPAGERIVEKQAEVVRHQALLQWLNDKKGVYKAQAKNNSSRQSNGSLSSIVNRLASQNGITIARVQPKGKDVLVSIDEVPFNAFMAWLSYLNEASVVVKSLDISNVDDNGLIKVRRLNLGKV